MCHASAGLTLTLSPARPVPRASPPAHDQPTFPCSLHGGRSPAMTGTSCGSTRPSTPQRRSSWPCRRPSPTRSAPSSWCPTCWPRRTPETQCTRAVSTGSGGSLSIPQAPGRLSRAGRPPRWGGLGFWTGHGWRGARRLTLIGFELSEVPGTSQPADRTFPKWTLPIQGASRNVPCEGGTGLFLICEWETEGDSLLLRVGEVPERESPRAPA